MVRSPQWLGWPLWKIFVTNDHRYVPLVVNTSRSLPNSWLITGVSLVEQELLTLPEPLSSPRVFVGFVFFSFMCMFGRSLFVVLCFFFWPLCCLFFFDIRILITPLVSSNSSPSSGIGDHCPYPILGILFMPFSLLAPKTSYCQWEGDEVRFVQDQLSELDFYSASSLKQLSAGRHVALSGHISLTPT